MKFRSGDAIFQFESDLNTPGDAFTNNVENIKQESSILAYQMIKQFCLRAILVFVSAGTITLSLQAEPRNAVSSDLYQKEEIIEIEGYDDNAMEPCISLDGQYLFFNSSNEENVETHIHFAKRLSHTRFKYLGLLPGTKSKKKDMAPSIDAKGQLYFTSLRSFDSDSRSIYTGQFYAEVVDRVAAVSGNISPSKPFWINMDCCISPDGHTLVISRAQFLPLHTGPLQSKLRIAMRDADGNFAMIEEEKSPLSFISSTSLDYAPAITQDLLELYFTRCAPGGLGKAPAFQTMVARRQSINQPFGAPQPLSAIQGFAEAPSLTLDKKELFFHKRVGKLFKIFVVTRNSLSEQKS